jgi:hypothetical protein
MNELVIVRLCEKKGRGGKKFEKVDQLHSSNKSNILCVRRHVSDNRKDTRVESRQFRNTVNDKFVKHNDQLVNVRSLKERKIGGEFVLDGLCKLHAHCSVA